MSKLLKMFLLLEVFCLVLLLQSLGFIASAFLNRNSFVDVLWGLVIAGMSIYCVVRLGTGTYQTLIIGVLMALWGLRLGWHTGLQFVRTKAEAPHYVAMSQNWSHYYLRSYLQVFLIQGVLMIVMLSGLMTTIIHPQVFSFYLLPLGVVIALIGLTLEVIADAQLGKFIKTKKPDQALQQGLWKFSRHPNYFGEVVFWCGLFVCTLPTPYWYLTILPPIPFLVLKISGIPLAEAQYKDNVDFQAYAARTNKFFPWEPKA